MISTNCTRDLFFSLATVSETSCPLFRAVDRCPARSTIELKYDTTIDTLSAVLLPVFGQRYISSLSFSCDGGILVKGTKIKGIRFMMGPYGLRALSILYLDDTISPWLGEPTNSWMGVMYGSSTRCLHVLRDVRSLSTLPFPSHR